MDATTHMPHDKKIESLYDIPARYRFLLFYLEACAVDFGGVVDSRLINEEDLSVMRLWKGVGLIDFGRITFSDVRELNRHRDKGQTHWVRLSEKAWELAHQERRERHERMWTKRTWGTTTEVAL